MVVLFVVQLLVTVVGAKRKATECSGLPSQWRNLETNAVFPVTTGESIEVRCKHGLVSDGGTTEIICIQDTTFADYSEDLLRCVKEEATEWTRLLPGTTVDTPFSPEDTTIELSFNRLRKPNNLKFSIATRFQKRGSETIIGNVNVFYQMKKMRIVKSKVRLGSKYKTEAMLYCNDLRTLGKALPTSLVQAVMQENVVHINSDRMANFDNCDQSFTQSWRGLAKSGIIGQVQLQLIDMNMNMGRQVEIYYRIVKVTHPTTAPATSPDNRFLETASPTPFYQLDNLELDPQSGPICSIYSPGVISSFTNEIANYDLKCSHVLAADVHALWFIYGNFDDFYMETRSLSSMMFYVGSNAFEIQRGWLINVGGAKFPLIENLEMAMDENNYCSVLFQDNVLRVDCCPFTVYFDGLMNAHMVLKNVDVGASGAGSGASVSESIVARHDGHIGLCFDNESGRRPNWQINYNNPKCIVLPGYKPTCSLPHPECFVLLAQITDCDQAIEMACSELFCDRQPGPLDLCAFQQAAALKCGMEGGVRVGYEELKLCTAEVCDWKMEILGTGCPQEPFFENC